MSYLQRDTQNGLPTLISNRGAMADSQLRRSLTRLDDIDATPRHVSFRPYSGDQLERRTPRAYSPLRDSRTRSPIRDRRDISPSRERRESSPQRSSSPRARSPTRCYSPTNNNKHINELQDQIRILKEELQKKESFIVTRSSKTDISSDRVAVEQARGEIAALNVKVENLVAKLRDAELEIESSHARLRDFKSTVEQSKENEARQAAQCESLRERIRELERESGALHSQTNKSEAQLAALQDERRHLDEKVKDLDSRIRTYIQDRENAEIKASSWEKKYQESLVILRSALNVEYNEPVDSMKVKIQEIVSENTTLKGKLCTLEETSSSSELESRANRETIARLVNEVAMEKDNASKYRSEIDSILREKDSALASHNDAVRECEILRERLDASQRAWSATKRELEEKTHTYSSLDHELRDHSQRMKSVQTRFEGFLEQLAHMLSVSTSEDLVKDRIRQLIGQSKDGSSAIGKLEGKIRSQDDQCRLLYDQRQKLEQTNQRAEIHIRELEDKLRSVDRELSNADVFKDGLRTDKERYLRFMERLAELMKMDRISAEVGFDMTGEALLARAAQLAKLEADALADRNTHIYNLQRKIKTLKEQLESKDLHLDLLRKKVSQLEERSIGKSDIEKERDSETVKVRRLEKTCDKYSKQLEHARLEITDLKAQLLDSTKYQVDNHELVAHCEKLESKIGQLDKIRQKQAKKITSLKDEMHVTESGGEDRMTKADRAISSLSSELKTTKQSLDDMTQRERQLVDLRTVLARMLGLDVNTLAVPDYEIISRLEKLIQAHHAHTLTNWSMDHALENMEDGLRTGYPSAKMYLGDPRPQVDFRELPQPPAEHRSRSPEKRGRSPDRRRRSPSPQKVDTRKY